ncbi:hypothetical protein [Planotetraspora sp. GP83]|uniref:hypothetical protein n=1 Tax=Planotetraspora sp. GP83 TaxID=3156264 RepID=UPI003516D35F
MKLVPGRSDRFLVLNRGTSLGEYGKGDITKEDLTSLMAGGAELDELAHEIQRAEAVPADR